MCIRDSYTAVNEGRPQDQKENTSYDLENAGKTCVCLNTKTAAGREALEKLIAGADIFTTNFGKMCIRDRNWLMRSRMCCACSSRYLSLSKPIFMTAFPLLYKTLKT